LTRVHATCGSSLLLTRNARLLLARSRIRDFNPENADGDDDGRSARTPDGAFDIDHRGRESLQSAISTAPEGLRKLVAEGEPTFRGSSFDKFGEAINNNGVIAFPAAWITPRDGGIFVAGVLLRMTLA